MDGAQGCEHQASLVVSLTELRRDPNALLWRCILKGNN